jgi:hypothetical protein
MTKRTRVHTPTPPTSPTDEVYGPLQPGDFTPCCDEPAERDPFGKSLCSGEHGYTHACPHCGQCYGADGKAAGHWTYGWGSPRRKLLRHQRTSDAQAERRFALNQASSRC